MNIFILVAILCFTASQSQAWSRHHLITEAALAGIPTLQTEMVTPIPLEPLLHVMGYRDQLDFNTKIKIKKEFIFALDKDEQKGVPVSVASVLSRYSDEPDWNMDREIFDEYPELWDEKYSAMGGRNGLSSQAFRHMYWGPFDPFHPLVSLLIPNPSEPRGQAPERAALFIALAKQAKIAGSRYWSMRFRANALHYPEDVSQPYHASQVQSPVFEVIPFGKFGNGMKKGFANYKLQVTHVIAYYHLSFEDYVGYVMGDGYNTIEAKRFRDALGNTRMRPHKNLVAAVLKKDAAELTKAMAHFSQAKAPKAASASRAFFPPISGYFAQRNVKLDAFNPEEYMDQVWWDKTLDRGHTDSKEERKKKDVKKQQYFEVVETIFAQLGYAIRALVLEL